MIELTESQIQDYLRRSYFSVDGLWFMKIEERYGFDTALDTDDEVWKILPKIQARLMKSFSNLKEGLHALRENLETKLVIDGFKFDIVRDEPDDGFTVHISECPWYSLLVKSNREHLAALIANRICTTEFTVWASQFGDDIECIFLRRLCEKSKTCSIQFIVKKRTHGTS